ncbi:MAG: type II secretion system protein [Mariprofundaceae bacterium]|nr:type II secretion system protein [Mariprofundaceae bacterium]
MNHLEKQQGFTLIELLITTTIGLIIMAGMTSVFVSQTRTANMLKNKTEVMGDLFLASQIMQSQLRDAKDICWNSASSTLVYQAVDSNVSILPCSTASPDNGSFKYQINTATDWKIMWKRPLSLMKPGSKGIQPDELLRGLPTVRGLVVARIPPPPATPSLPVIYKVDLQSNFTGQANQAQTLGLTFKVWARNK